MAANKIPTIPITKSLKLKGLSKRDDRPTFHEHWPVILSYFLQNPDTTREQLFSRFCKEIQPIDRDKFINNLSSYGLPEIRKKIKSQIIKNVNDAVVEGFYQTRRKKGEEYLEKAHKEVEKALYHASKNAESINQIRDESPKEAIHLTRVHTQSLDNIHKVAESVYDLKREEKINTGMYAIAFLAGQVPKEGDFIDLQ